MVLRGRGQPPEWQLASNHILGSSENHHPVVENSIYPMKLTRKVHEGAIFVNLDIVAGLDVYRCVIPLIKQT